MASFWDAGNSQQGRMSERDATDERSMNRLSDPECQRDGRRCETADHPHFTPATSTQEDLISPDSYRKQAIPYVIAAAWRAR